MSIFVFYSSKMTNQECLLSFYDNVKKSIENSTFAKLTFAKTIGNSELMNIYIRTVVENNILVLELKYKFWHEEKVEIFKIDQAFEVLTTYIGNPFLLLLLFTTENDITLKINKKRDYKISEQPPTFKNAADVIVAFYKN